MVRAVCLHSALLQSHKETTFGLGPVFVSQSLWESVSSKLAQRVECHYSLGFGNSLRNIILGEARESGDLWVVIVLGFKGSEPYHIRGESVFQGKWF